MSTSKAVIERVIVETDVFCEAARSNISSFTPSGLGPEYRAELRALEEVLEDVPRRFKRLIRKAQKEHGWAAR